jgi:transcriptional regulator with XRE-family HTH domain
MTLEVLSKRSGLTPNYIGGVETGKRDPSLSTILALAKGLGISASELFPSVADLSAASENAGRLFDRSTPEIQNAVLGILRATLKMMRTRRKTSAE